MDSLDYIVKMRHVSKMHGADGTARGFISQWREKMHREKGVLVSVKGIGLEGGAQGTQGNTVLARIWQGQWIADCECGGAEFVDPDEPIFFCWSCVNRANGGWVRRVQFPDDWQAIEAMVLERPVNDVRGATDLERAGMARAAVTVKTDAGEFPLTRSWSPDEALDELKRQNEALKGVEVKPGKTTVVEISSPPTPLPKGEGRKRGK